MKNELIVKDNALINASYNLDLVEQRLILLAIVEARESKKGIDTNNALTVHASSYINHFKVEKHTAYEVLKNACESLFSRQFSYQFKNEHGNTEYVRSRWVSKISYVDNEAFVKLVFAPDVVPLITRLEQHFTSYEIKQVSQLTSRYAVRLYELLIAWRSVGKTPLFEIKEFREQLGVEDSEYNRTEAFKRRVLEIAIDQISELTDITVKYEQHKKGRSIIGFSFTLIQKNINKKTKEQFEKLTDKQILLFANKLAYDPEFSNTYSLLGESYEQFELRIIAELAHPQKLKEYSKYLEKIGFKN